MPVSSGAARHAAREAEGVGVADRQNEELLIALLEADRRQCEESYYHFFQRAWCEVLEASTPLVNNWHIHYLCWRAQEEVERIARGEPKKHDIIINVPPRSLKTSIFTIMLQAWAWIRWPWMKFLTASYDDGLAAEHAVATRRLIRSQWYQSYWSDRYSLSGDQGLKTSFQNDKLGIRIATSVGGSATGRGGDLIICDDPLSAKQADSEVYRKGAIDWWDKTMFSRLNDPNVGVRIIVMQRLHEEDLTGNELEKRRERYEHICLSADQTKGPVSPEHLRELYTGDLLFPQRFSKEFLAEAQKSLGEYGLAGQYYQLPAPESGGMFKKDRWKYWQFPGDQRRPVQLRVVNEVKTLPLVELPIDFDEIINSWDMSFKDTDGTDYVAGHCWARKGANKYLLQRIKKRMDFAATVSAVRELKEQSGFVGAILVEDKANGPAVISSLKNEIAGIIAIKATDSKQSRATPMSRQQEAGNLYLPHPDIDDSIDQLVLEFAAFPKGKHDDEVDASAHAVNFLSDPAHQVIGSYHWSTHRRPFDIKSAVVHKVLSANYVTMVQQEDLSLAVLCGVWDTNQGKLWIYDEILEPYAVPAMLAGEIMMKASQGGPVERYLGDPKMFGETPTERTIVNQMKKSGIRLRLPLKFEENGAIALTIQMFMAGNVVVHKTCQATDRQLREWIVEKGRPKNKNTGLCRCLCLMVSDLERRFRITPTLEFVPTYGKVSPEERRRKNSWQAA